MWLYVVLLDEVHPPQKKRLRPQAMETKSTFCACISCKVLEPFYLMNYKNYIAPRFSPALAAFSLVTTTNHREPEAPPDQYCPTGSLNLERWWWITRRIIRYRMRLFSLFFCCVIKWQVATLLPLESTRGIVLREEDSSRCLTSLHVGWEDMNFTFLTIMSSTKMLYWLWSRNTDVAQDGFINQVTICPNHTLNKTRASPASGGIMALFPEALLIKLLIYHTAEIRSSPWDKAGLAGFTLGHHAECFFHKWR